MLAGSVNGMFWCQPSSFITSGRRGGGKAALSVWLLILFHLLIPWCSIFILILPFYFPMCAIYISRCFPLHLLFIFVTVPSLHCLEGNSLECSIRLLSATHHALFLDLHPSMPDGVHGPLLFFFHNNTIIVLSNSKPIFVIDYLGSVSSVHTTYFCFHKLLLERLIWEKRNLIFLKEPKMADKSPISRELLV